jgi:hypothetical protein
MATAIPYGWQVENANGVPVSGAKVYFYQPGTTTPRTTYSDDGLTVPASNPVIADSAGWFNTYLSSELPYDIVIKSADDSITYQERTVASNIAGAQPVDASLTAFAALDFDDGEVAEATGTDTFRARVLHRDTYAALTAIAAADRFDNMVVYVKSRATDGDGAEGYWWFDSGSSATANGGTILAPDAGTGRWLRHYSKTVGADARWFGVLADYDSGTDTGTDNAAALQAALDACYWVRLPEGNILLEDKVRVDQFHRLSGVTDGATILWANGDFNLSATAILDTGGAEPGGWIEDLQILHVQADTATRGDLTAYPDTIVITAARSRIENVKIKRAVKGITSSTNCGGTHIGNVEVSAFNGAIDIDGWQHTGWFRNIDSGVYDMTANQIAHRADGTYYDVTIGRIDDLKWKGGIIFQHPKALRIKSNATVGQITDIDLDDYGGLYVEGGRHTISGYATLGQTDGVWAVISGGMVRLSMDMTQTVVNTNSLMQISGDAEVVLDCVMDAETAADVHLIEVTSGTPIICIDSLKITRAPNSVTYSNEFLSLGGATGYVTGVQMLSAKGTSTGTVLTSTASAANMQMSDNNANGWTEGQLNGWRTWTPTFTGNAAGALTATANMAEYRRIGNLVHFRLNATLNDKLSAADPFYFSLPFTNGSVESTFFGREMASTGSQLVGTINASASSAFIQLYDGTGPLVNGYRYSVEGFYVAA